MSAAPLVSVIVPVFNRQRWLPEALTSVFAQTFDDYELIVVDDGSTDQSRLVAMRAVERHPGRCHIRSISNSGVATARNTGMVAARGQYIAFLDSDDAWLPNHLERAMDAFNLDPDLGLVHANIERIDAAGEPLGIPIRHWQVIEHAFEAIALRHEHVACSTVIVSRDAIEAVGKFDERFDRLGCEDRDLWLRIADRYRIRYLPHVGARYRDHATGLSADLPRMQEARRLLIAKLGESDRGRPLVAAMEAMMESDLGFEYLIRHQYIEAIRQQWVALQLDPSERILWKRLLRVIATVCLAGVFAHRASTRTGGVR
jgi:glycosyltransferase involved in cell wall biosynthesis